MRIRALALCFALLIGFSIHSSAQITGASCPESAKFYSRDSVNVITFGASTVAGVNGLDFQTYLTTNFLNCYTNKTINIQKYGVFGETTTKGLARIDNAIAYKTGFIVILIGANDALEIEAGRQKIAETEASMRTLIVKSLNQNLVPIVCTIQNFDDRNDARLRRVNVQVLNINNLYKKLVKEYGVYLADLNAAIRRDFTLYQDIVHPNARGNRLISFVLFDVINKIIAERFLEFTLTQNYPNPGRERTSIDIVMPEADKVELKIYNLQGNVVQTVLNEYLNTGKHTIELNLSLLAPGIYIYRLVSLSGLHTATRKMIVVR
ncbi:T9SS type A sorting domain-containing protein [Pedobacter frigiditerrae]|uniref:T9SS type A sorting domain-containing protein n=1 Tax=Pedobacter frigiditerrae TaxID=2530452 RepID=A0A4R0MRT9_9SPHI|nr:GDSL-type esterase/lipase family protein [Pedobacter frigiditerrae]TCC89327.1 T9SS type A sorting domain-containing protein [Pedobacter frigiditerrae]